VLDHLLAVTLGAHPDLRTVYPYALVALDIQEFFPGSFMLFVNFAQLEIVEPDASAAIPANVDNEIADLFLLQFSATCWTLHHSTSSPNDDNRPESAINLFLAQQPATTRA